MTVENKKKRQKVYAHEWYLRNRDLVYSRTREWRKNNREKVNRGTRAWQLRNPERVNINHANWRKNNREKVRTQKRASYWINSEYYKKKRNDYRKTHPEKAIVKDALRSLCQGTCLTSRFITEELIQTKIAQIKLIRLCKQLTNPAT